MAVWISILSLTKFAKYFSETFVASNPLQAVKLENDFNHMSENYFDSPYRDEYLFDVELISTVISRLKPGMAAGLDDLAAEHLIHCLHIISKALY
jgi:hypothetical protein